MTKRQIISRNWRNVLYPQSSRPIETTYISKLFIVTVLAVLLIFGLISSQRFSPTQNFKRDSTAVPSTSDSLTRPGDTQEKTTDMTDSSSTNSSDTHVSVSSDRNGSTVTINDETIQATPNQSVDHSYESNDGSTKVDVSIDNHTSGNESSSQRTRLRVNSDSTTSTRSYSSTDVRSSE